MLLLNKSLVTIWNEIVEIVIDFEHKKNQEVIDHYRKE